MMEKKRKRVEMLKSLKMIEEKHYYEMSQKIHEQFLALEIVEQAKVIGITISKFPEVETRMLIKELWKRGKTVVVPRCHPQTREMDFRKINSFTELEYVYYDLAEPKIEETISIRKQRIDVLVVPGVVFSAKGYRIGFGGGYYDRFLVDYEGHVLSFAFALQTNQKIPIEKYDVPVVKIITESSIIDCRKGKSSD